MHMRAHPHAACPCCNSVCTNVGMSRCVGPAHVCVGADICF